MKQDTFSELINEEEPSVVTSIQNLIKIADPKFGLIESLTRERQYYDEPKFWYFSSHINNEFTKNDGRSFHVQASGFSFFSKEIALLKCLGETIERYCNFIFLDKYVDYKGSIESVKDKAFDPRNFSRFSSTQLKSKIFKRFKISNNSGFSWTKVESLLDNSFILIPTQYIYLSYPLISQEPVIYFSISTGVAGGSSKSAALARGICEIIERDAFMIYYLNKLPAKKIRLDTIKNINVKKLIQTAKRYDLRVVALDLTTDISIPVVAAIILDKSGVGKAVSVGLKCDLNPVEALVGAITEAFHTRGGIREEYENNPRTVKARDLLKRSDIKTRGLLWYQVKSINKLNFWINNPEQIEIKEDFKNLNSGEYLRKLVDILKEGGFNILYKDLMVKELRELNYFVFKVIIPELQPLYLDEKYKLLGGKRLYDVPRKLGYDTKNENQLNNFPHPFL